MKKVASFTLEKASAGSANSKINNGDPNSGMLGQLENIGSKRSTFVPEKLSFAAYEKFEGKFYVSSCTYQRTYSVIFVCTSSSYWIILMEVDIVH